MTIQFFIFFFLNTGTGRNLDDFSFAK